MFEDPGEAEKVVRGVREVVDCIVSTSVIAVCGSDSNRAKAEREKRPRAGGSHDVQRSS